MAVNEGGGGGVPGGVVEFVVDSVNSVFAGGTNSPNRRQRDALIAAGYEYGAYRNGAVVAPPANGRFVPAWVSPTGQIFSQNQAREIARNIIQSPPIVNAPVVVNPPAPPPNYPSTTVYYPPPGGSDPGRVWPPPPPRPPPSGPINPNAPPPGPVFPSMWPYVIGQIIGPDVYERIKVYNDIIGGVFDTVTKKPPLPIPKGPTNPRGRAPAGQGNPWPPQGPPITVIVNMPQAPPAPKKPPDPLAGLGNIYVSKRRLPIPSPPPPAPKPVPRWQQLLPLLSPLLGVFTGSKGNTRVRLTDPLTQPQTSTPLTTSYSTLVGSAFGGSSGVPGTNTCLCKEPRKKRRKRKRSVCYSGTYIERADGTRKTKKRKVACL